ncbi:hypothetical protein [Rhizobium rhizogenes]|uniref:hypothetical protein n=1 Tax=Rhizobium rhizogenes TaxID=359 RepID=UPI001571F0B5|nr:hypothetical protein [Rhizobium rhizogenes]NTF67942.1 hypothetical protein [Rhizobium rhizogenes]
MSEFLLGLQYCGGAFGAFGMFVVAVVGACIAYALFRLVYGQSLDSRSDDESGALEGDFSFHHRHDRDDLNGKGR